MILVYSGATQPDQSSNADKALGGYVSNSIVLNGMIGNLFSTITKSSIVNKLTETKMIVLRNTTGVTVNNLKIYTEVVGTDFILKLGAVEPGQNTCGQSFFEQIPSQNSSPLQAVLTQQEGEVNAIQVPELLDGGMIGIWIQRVYEQSLIDKFKPITVYDDASIDELEQLSEPQEPGEFTLQIKWD